jgi:hypothetical protein
MKTVKEIHDFFTKKMLMPEISFSRGVSNVILEDGVGVQMFGKSIIPGDNSCSDDFFVHIPDGIDDVNISWKLLSRHFPAEGTLKIHVEKIYVEDYRYNEEKGLTSKSLCLSVDH